ncbi:MAG TPA: pilin [Patescibacteria group bacterium]|nr:pilin [Patescibacteria group bacterium]
MSKKYFLVFTFLTTLFLFSPFLVLAQGTEDVPPELNPICWQQKECEEKRRLILDATGIQGEEYMDEKVKEGWVPNEEPCNKDGWGKCLPANLTRTEISFGGKNTFTNVGQFLQTNYNYLLGIAAILAVAMIVIAGFQWTASGGNSEMIGSAKKRITGAIIGLFIAYMSFFILNTINPALVNLRLPQTWLIRAQQLADTFCDSVDPSAKLAHAGQGNNLVPFESLKATDFKISPTYFRREETVFQRALGACRELENTGRGISGAQTGGVISKYWCLESLFKELEKTHAPLEKNLIAMCGNKYYASNNPQATCQGNVCKPTRQLNRFGKIEAVAMNCALDKKQTGDAGLGSGNYEYSCEPGALTGILRDPQNRFGNSPLESVWLAEVCNNGVVNEQWTQKASGQDIAEFIDNQSNFEFGQEYISGSTECDDKGNTAGIYIVINVDDRNDVLGTADDDLAVGCRGGGSVCNTNLAYILNNEFKTAPGYFELMGGGQIWTPFGNYNFNPSIEHEEDEVRAILGKYGAPAVDFIRSYLLKPQDIYQGKNVEINLLQGFIPD